MVSLYFTRVFLLLGMGCFVLTTKLDMYGTIEGGGEGRRQGVKNSELVFSCPPALANSLFFSLPAIPPPGDRTPVT